MKVKIALIQLNSGPNKLENLNLIKSFIDKASQLEAQMCFLPEAFAFLDTKMKDEDYEAIDGNFMKALRETARNKNIWLSLGGFIRKVDGQEKKLNSHIIVDNQGQILRIYEKIHLYNLKYGTQQQWNEGKKIQQGNVLPDVIDTPVGKVGLSICYDMRFPEMYRLQMLQGAQILTAPSAFMKVTGEAHWETILRCRAIENQCFMVAAAQTGKHGEIRESYGHSMIVDPWGRVLLDMKDDVGVEVIELDLGEIDKIRKTLPAIENIRKDLYKIVKL